MGSEMCIRDRICHEWNTTAHLVDYEGRAQRRALTYDELEQFFTAADARVGRTSCAGPPMAAPAMSAVSSAPASVASLSW